jgi:hypothetical protein
MAPLQRMTVTYCKIQILAISKDNFLYLEDEMQIELVNFT